MEGVGFRGCINNVPFYYSIDTPCIIIIRILNNHCIIIMHVHSWILVQHLLNVPLEPHQKSL